MLHGAPNSTPTAARIIVRTFTPLHDLRNTRHQEIGNRRLPPRGHVPLASAAVLLTDDAAVTRDEDVVHTSCQTGPLAPERMHRRLDVGARAAAVVVGVKGEIRWRSLPADAYNYQTWRRVRVALPSAVAVKREARKRE
eukprot:CAMPEP_0181255870 /NCGR_PEP_ID=MMETSP1096-20121128/49401_1 /TAXON_ID=156174 ORGANISM="Chrysochromulina ericina, Strain CCMP281" /NCGR_SAMPLE_ID=MMETSP1096 /ASSEMBLY_ACC=CAM_ASM_000453 /LENGTH=138 /DNA_ID=CAMNT_0023354069 /DNA_START=187 /DNA_END=604 /DNA_ORIENTATION=+